MMDSILGAKVRKGSAAIWWLCQMGFLIKTPAGTVVSIDAYLTDSCRKIGESVGLDLSRRVPVQIEPRELQADYFLCTHSHQDHADPETIRQLRQERFKAFAGPGLVCETYRRCKISEKRIRQLYAGGAFPMGDVTVHATFAMPTDDSDVNHVGYVLDIKNGPRIYLTGDTDYSDLLASAAKFKPDVMIACINGGFNNLSHWEAAELARRIEPRIAIPCHFDMFPDNAVEPTQFMASLTYLAPKVTYRLLKHFEKFEV
jgi:L-ascorbate 6-phosphate lactonase